MQWRNVFINIQELHLNLTKKSIITAKMSAEAILVSFSELQAIDQEDIIILVDVQTAIRTCNESLTNDSANPADLLLLWLNKLLRAYLDEAVCCVNAIKEMWSWLGMVTDDPKYDRLAISTEALNFATTYKDHILKGGERLVHSLAFFFFTMINKFSSDRSVLKICVELHLIVLSLLKDNTAESKAVNFRIIPLIQGMAAIAEFLGGRITHLQASIKTSETMTFMCVHYLELIKQQPKKEKEMPEWLKDTLVHLCDSVCSQLETVQQEETHAVPLEKIEEYLKVTRTYLLNLREIFRVGGTMPLHDLVNARLVELLIETKPPQDLSKDILQLLSTYVKPYVFNIFELVYLLDDFQKFVSHILDTEENAIDHCLDFVTVVCINSTEVTPNTYQLLQKIFEYLFKDASNFVHAENYERVIESFGSLLYLLDNKNLHNYFYAGLFQKDIVSSQACADVLMLCFRLKEVNKGWGSKAIEQAVSFWNKCNNSYALFSHNPSQWHVQRFLKYFHCLGREKLPALSFRNFRQLTAVAGSSAQIGRKLLKHLDDITSVVPTNTGNYYEIIAVLNLLAQLGQTDCGQWLKRTSDMAKKLMSMDKSSTFVSAYFRLLATADQATQLLVLRGLAPLTGCTNWQRQKFLAACKFSNDAQLRAFSACHCISEEVQPLLEALLGNPQTPDSSIGATSQELWKSSYCRKEEHKCQSETNLKRKRGQESMPKHILQDLYEGSLQLSQCSQDTFDAADIELHRKVIANLSSLLPRP